MALAFDIPTVWAFIIAFAVFVYVGIDGFDLGLGMLFPLFPKKADRDVIMKYGRPRMGWQRDLARAWRRQVVRGFSARLRGIDARTLYADHRHAARPGVSLANAART